jgi:hypothetical protein
MSGAKDTRRFLKNKNKLSRTKNKMSKTLTIIRETLNKFSSSVLNFESLAARELIAIEIYKALKANEEFLNTEKTAVAVKETSL